MSTGLPARGPPIFGVTGFVEHWRPFTHDVTTTELQGWLEPMTDADDANRLVGVLLRGHRDLFADPPDPSESES